MRSFKTILTVVGAVTVLVLAANTVAYAATGGKFILGKTNKANKVSTLKRTTNGSALNLITKSSSNAPLSTNGKGKVANLNADMLDGKDSTAFAPYPKVIRGNWGVSTTAAAANTSLNTGISFGWTLPSAPTAHLIEIGDPLPAGCSGTAAAPNASPGHLCVFVSHAIGGLSDIGLCNLNNTCPGADRTGSLVYAYSSGTGTIQWSGSWAVRAASVSASRVAPSTARTSSGSRVASGR
jgi:hypothetical protein